MTAMSAPRVDDAAPVATTWPCERFYWAILEVPGMLVSSGPAVPGQRVATSALDEAFEQVIPAPLTQVHAVYLRLDSGRVLACAVDTGALGELPESVVTLTPSALPAFISAACRSASSPRASDLNLLVGKFEARPVLRERRRGLNFAAAAIVLGCGLLSVGLLRRSGTAAESASISQTSFQTLASKLKPVNSPRLGDVVTHLDREIDELSRILEVPDPAADESRDAALILEALVAHWPQRVAVSTDLISIAPGTITMTVRLDGDARPFLQALKAPAGWELDPPRLSASRGTNQLSIQFKRSEPRKAGAR